MSNLIRRSVFTFGWSALLLSGVPTSADDALTFDHHMRIGINMEALSSTLALVQRQDFYAVWDNNGRICGIGEVHARTETVGLSATPYWSSPTASTSLIVEPRVKGFIEARNCGLYARITCVGAALVSNEADKGGDAHCRSWGGVLRIPVPFEIPVKVPSEHVVEARQPTPEEPEHALIEFGALDANGNWVPQADPSRRKVSTAVVFTGFDGDIKAIGETSRAFPEALWLEHAKRVVIDATIGDRTEERSPDEYSALASMGADLQLSAREFVGISLAPTFFGAAAPSGLRAGLFGQLLPIRLTGIKRVLGLPVAFEAILSEARTGFGLLEDTPVIVVQLIGVNGHLGFGPIRLPWKIPMLTFVLSAPTIQPDGTVSVLLEKAQVVLVNGFAGCLCLDLSQQDQPIKLTAFRLASLVPQWRYDLPQCVDVSDDRMVPASSNFARISCAQPPKPGQGQMARVGVNGIEATLELSGVQPELRNGRLHYKIPYSAKTY